MLGLGKPHPGARKQGCRILAKFHGIMEFGNIKFHDRGLVIKFGALKFHDKGLVMKYGSPTFNDRGLVIKFGAPNFMTS